MKATSKKPSALAFGETLWDIFPDRSVIGGAPYNFAAHFALMGGASALLSAVGDDELGVRTLELIRDHGVSDRFVTRLPNIKTGVCNVSLSETGAPEYDLSQVGAYDKIQLSEELEEEIRAGNFELFYFGTLAQRSAGSRGALNKLLDEYSSFFREIFFDVNIRQSYYSREIAEKGLLSCTTLKFSREECGVFAELGLTPSELKGPEDICPFLSEKYNIPRIIATLDRDGSMLYENGRICRSEKPKTKVVSTVGAGDGYSAAFMYSALSGASPVQCIKNASDRASFVCEHTEAVPR